MKTALRSLTPAVLILLASTAPALAIDAARKEKAEKMVTKAIDYLRTKQDTETGGWAVPKGPQGKGRANFPAITSLILNGMLHQPGIDAKDPSVAKGLKYVLSFRQSDGGIYDGDLPSYNTAISLSMLARAKTPEADAAILPAQNFLRNNQWGAPAPVGGKEAPTVVTQGHPNYGGWGYGNRGRPDISNSAFAIDALHDSGLPKDDPAFKRAVVFLQRLQMDPKVNDMAYAKGSKQGGFIYATGENAQTIGQGNSFAGTIEETMDDGSKVSMLRAYGSATYQGFKSYIYAGLTPDDPRVVTAMKWLSSHYSPVENPGIGTDGFYYYILAMARALDATKSSTLTVSSFEPLRQSIAIDALPSSVTVEQITELVKSAGKPSSVIILTGSGDQRSAVVSMAKDEEAAAAEKALASATLEDKPLKVSRFPASVGSTGKRDWQNDMIDTLALLQNADGSFKSIDDRWMENVPDLVTAYSLLAIQEILRD